MRKSKEENADLSTVHRLCKVRWSGADRQIARSLPSLLHGVGWLSAMSLVLYCFCFFMRGYLFRFTNGGATKVDVAWIFRDQPHFQRYLMFVLGLADCIAFSNVLLFISLTSP